jgi:hypothetical protein
MWNFIASYAKKSACSFASPVQPKADRLSAEAQSAGRALTEQDDLWRVLFKEL